MSIPAHYPERCCRRCKFYQFDEARSRAQERAGAMQSALCEKEWDYPPFLQRQKLQPMAGPCMHFIPRET